ncbi:chemotaxis protein CheW [Blastopirellula marina]|uniref:histidine kinase n=1 Tax=Blastopirellula marina TaxID=124 RepID=A0A2S8FPA4_9BACT|nr:chemotaxis protein CheW [Blastopirellula marina]PQO33840.1 hybrid sensor histidine kinase/response regulator [Blastopirellula marina]PTL43627.1 hybrid sensor histidine kinase/response regulator [Blastopirellula marina]
MSFDDPALLAEFVTESREHLADVEGQLLEIESAGADIDVDLVNKVFRAIHSIKGAAGFMGLTRINELAHALENVLGKMRTKELAPNSAIVDVMLRAADALSGLINDVENSNEVDVLDHIERLNEINDGPIEATSRDTEPEVVCKPVDHIPIEIVTPVERTTLEAPAPARTSHVESSIRVPVGVLDRLMNLAGELVLGRNQLLQTVSNSEGGGMQAVAARMDQVTSELQEAIMQTRMQPIGNVFNKFPRVVRDLSAKLGKQCQVLMEGGEVEVDKTIIEAIGDPLTHMVRNSVDHGVEMPDVRMKNGKEPTGTITLRAYHQAGKVRIDICDDGGGIDTNRLKDKAVNKGIITAERAAQMSERDAVWLIFHPGFSMAEKISDVSGRGVGMDVVRTNIEKIGGAVDIDSTLGKGTTIQITLPLTLAIIPSMLIRSHKRRFAIPQVNIVELVRVRASEANQRISKVKGAHVLRLRGALLPLVELDDVLNFHEAGIGLGFGDKARQIVVVESGQFRYGLVVDEIDDSEEIVVKPLGRHLKSCTCLAGATILGDGHVAPILDVSGIATKSDLRTHEQEAQKSESSDETTRQGERQSLLMFTNAPNEFFAIPMSLISRIERIRTEQIDTVGGQELLQYRGTSLPLLAVEQFIKAQTRPTMHHVHVVVFQIQGREIGLIAADLNDILDISAEIDGNTFREPGVAGSVVVEDKTVRMLDLYELALAAHPKWFEDKPKEHVHIEEKPYNVLLVEDSSFFRKQAKEYLVSEGFHVIDVEDGLVAWETLTSGEEDIDLVITDIEMPRMNGFELTRKIKTDSTLHVLPVIALTSLASDEDQRTGREAGVDDYQIKMNRERVMAAAWRLLTQNRRSRTNQPAVVEGCLS